MTKSKIQIQKVPLEELKKILPPEALNGAGNQSGKVKKKIRPMAKSNGTRPRS